VRLWQLVTAVSALSKAQVYWLVSSFLSTDTTPTLREVKDGHTVPLFIVFLVAVSDELVGRNCIAFEQILNFWYFIEANHADTFNSELFAVRNRARLREHLQQYQITELRISDKELFWYNNSIFNSTSNDILETSIPRIIYERLIVEPFALFIHWIETRTDFGLRATIDEEYP